MTVKSLRGDGHSVQGSLQGWERQYVPCMLFLFPQKLWRILLILGLSTVCVLSRMSLVPVLGLCGVLGWKGRCLCGIVLWLLSEVFSPFSWVILSHMVLDALPPGH